MHGAAQICDEADSRKLAFRWLSHRKFMGREPHMSKRKQRSCDFANGAAQTGKPRDMRRKAAQLRFCEWRGISFQKI